MHIANLTTLEIATLLRRSHLEMVDGSTPEIRAEGERTYRSIKAQLAAVGEHRPAVPWVETDRETVGDVTTRLSFSIRVF